MPIYEYYCDTCQRRFDLLRSFSQAQKPAICPICNHESGQRMISLFASFAKEGSESRSVGGGGCGSCSSHSCAGCKH
jgi:putative FmdB family regulatory protein